MPDISMCENKDCELSKTCYRFNATPGYVQSYSIFKPTTINGVVMCDNYMKPHYISSNDIPNQSNTNT